MRRPHTPPAGVAAQIAAPDVEVHDETSDMFHKPDERAAFRAERELADRCAILEVKADETTEAIADAHDMIAETNTALGKLDGKVGDMNFTLGKMAGEVGAMHVMMSRADALKTNEANAEVERAKAIIAAADKATAAKLLQQAAATKRWTALGKILVSAILAIGTAYGACNAYTAATAKDPGKAVDR